MKKYFYAWAILALCSVSAFAQNNNSVQEEPVVDRNLYPDYTPPKPLSEAERKELFQKLFKNRSLRSVSESRPRRWNNAETKHFPPVFNQDDGSCGSASTIAYQFTHEINSYRDADGSLEVNQYPTHFTWLLTNHNSDKEVMAATNGIPNVVTYGGRTYSKLFGQQTNETEGFGWMQGYDKWYSAMFNKIEGSMGLGNLGDEETREFLKHWLWNHCGDEDFHSGGLAGTGLAAYGTWERIPAGSYEAGKYYVKYWGKDYNHAMTFVGYDDDIEIDLNENGVIDDDEKGAWIMVNSWGDWCNKGFIYCPYKNARSTYNPDTETWGGWMGVGCLKVRKNYKPKRTIKILMNYSRRNELRLNAGISQDTSATDPESTIVFEHFKFAGGATPMLGRWKDGMHTESMEFGYDLTDLTVNYDQTKPLKYFFIIETKSDATGEGVIDACSIIDYECDSLGIETPFPDKNVTVLNKGKKTIISVVVSPSQSYPVNNFSIDSVEENRVALSWNQPAYGLYNLTGYRLYRNSNVLVDLPATQLQFTDPNTQLGACYQISAIYEIGGQTVESKLSERVMVKLDSPTAQSMTFNGSGFSIPDVFAPSRDNFTIEFWANPTSVRSWNWHIGPGWGSFLFHFNGSGTQGTMTAGFNTGNNRLDQKGVIRAGQWTHVAIVVQGGSVILYQNGNSVASGKFTSYKGLSSVKDFSVGRTSDEGIAGAIDEFRVWNTARTADEIKNYYDKELMNPELEADLLAYYPMDTLPDGRLREAKNGYHATLLSKKCAYAANCPSLNSFEGEEKPLVADFELPEGSLYAGIPVELQLKASGYTSLIWNAPEAGITDKKITVPTLIYPEAGNYKIMLKAIGMGDNVEEIEKDITILPIEKPKADFDPVFTSVSVGERMSFVNKSVGDLCDYEWYFEGGTPESANTFNAATSYARFGNYTVRLIATNAAGADTIVKEDIVTVERIAPQVDFEPEKYEVTVGEKIRLNDLSKNDPTEWLWTVENEAVETYTDQNPEIEFSMPGIYSITLKASNVAGSNEITKTNYITVMEQPSGNALNFDGTDDYVEINDLFKTEPLKAFTIEWWMYAKGNVADGHQMGADASTILMQSNALGSLKIMLGGEKNVLNVASTADKPFIKVGEWIHLALVFDNGRLTVYKNGKEITSKKFSGMTEAPAWVNGFNLGTGNGKTLNALIDEFRVWSVACSQMDIIKNINTPLKEVETQTGLELYYNFDQNSGDVKDVLGKHEGRRVNFGPDGDAWSTSHAFNVTVNARKIKVELDAEGKSQATVSFEGGVGKKRAVFIKKASDADGYPVDGESYTALGNLSNAEPSLPGSGYVCIYNGNKESFVFGGMESFTEYELQIVEYFEIDRKPCYLQTSSHARFTTGLFEDAGEEISDMSAVAYSIYQTESDIHVLFAQSAETHTVSLYTIEGVLAAELTVGEEAVLSKSALTSGVYIIRVDGKSAQKVIYLPVSTSTRSS